MLKPKLKTHSQKAPIAEKVVSGTRGRLIALIGLPGMGKTSLAAEFPNPYFVIDPRESGIVDLMESGQVKKQINYQHVRDFVDLQRLNDSFYYDSIPDGVQTLVYESISGFEQQAILNCNDIDFQGKWTDTANQYQILNRDRIVANKYWASFMGRIAEFRERGINIVLTGHSEVKNAKNPRGPDYMIETCKCSGPVWSETDYIFENIFFLTFDVEVEKENKFARAKAFDNAARKLYCHKTPYHAAKNRCGISEPIDAQEGPHKTYRNLCTAARWDTQTLRYL